MAEVNKKSEALKRSWKDPLRREKARNRMKGNQINKGRKLSEEHKKKLRSYKHTEEAKDKIRGRIPWNYVDGRSNNPRPRATIKGKIKSHFIYCNTEGNHPYVPKGFVIHHIDMNPDNDSPDNLVMMLDRDHRVLHNQISKLMVGGVLE